MAFEMYFPCCFQLRITTQQESMLRTPPTTSLPSFTWQVVARFIIILITMSASLPRIRSVHQMGKPVDNKRTTLDVPAALKVKFRRLPLEEPGDLMTQRRGSLKTIMSSRLNSVERYSNVQEQRQFKNEKIHLNLIQRKLLAGTYDEKLQTGNQLTSLKHKRDQMRVDMAAQQKEIERMKAMLEDVRQETQVFLSKKGQHDERIKELKQRSDAQVLRAETAREARSVYENMILLRQEINITLGKRHHAAKEELTRLQNGLALMDTELREASQKCAVQQAKLQSILKAVQRQKHERTEQIGKHQERISRRKEGEVLQAQKSRKYIAFLDDVQRQGELKDFHSIYDKILANIFVARYSKVIMQELRQRFQKFQTAFNVVRVYRSFDTERPNTLVQRFFQHSPEQTHLQTEIASKEEEQTALENKREALRQTLQRAKAESDQLQEAFELSHHAQVMAQERQEVSQLRRECEQAQEKTVRIKNSILVMMKSLNQKADKRVFTGNQSTFNNLTQLTTVLRDAFKKLQ